jgi:hypothetical protein
VILIYLTSYTASPPETAVARNPVPPLKKEIGKNPIGQKKQGPEFYTDSFSALRAPIARLNRFRRRKNSSNGSSDTGVPADWFPPDRGKDGNGHTVTTRHLLVQHLPGNAGALLPFTLPNATWLEIDWLSERRRGGGGSAGWNGRKLPYR